MSSEEKSTEIIMPLLGPAASELTQLPLEIIHRVIDRLIDQVGCRKALHLRTVCKAFDEAIMHSVFTFEPLNWHDWSYLQAMHNMVPPHMARLIHHAVVKNRKTDRYTLVSLIGESIKALKRDDLTEQESLNICEAVAQQLRSNRKPCARYLDGLKDLPSTNERNQCILCAAVVIGDLSNVQDLVKSEQADIGEESFYFGRPLQIAAAWGHLEILEWLLDQGADPSCVSGQLGGQFMGPRGDWTYPVKSIYRSSAGTALQAACLTGHEKIVEVLLKQKCFDLNYMRYLMARECVLAAARGGHADIVHRITSNLKWARLELVELQWHTFWEASFYGRDDVVRLVMRELIKGAAYYTGCDHCARYHLIEEHPDYRFHMSDPITQALLFAVNHDRPSTVRLLLQYEPRPCVPDGSFLELAVRRGFEKTTAALLTSNIFGSYADALELALESIHPHLVRYLVEEGGSDLGKIIKRSPELLRSPVTRGMASIVRILAQAGCPLNSDDRSLDAVLLAKHYGQNEILDVLLELGAEDKSYPIFEVTSRHRVEFFSKVDHWMGRYG